MLCMPNAYKIPIQVVSHKPTRPLQILLEHHCPYHPYFQGFFPKQLSFLLGIGLLIPSLQIALVNKNN